MYRITVKTKESQYKRIENAGDLYERSLIGVMTAMGHIPEGELCSVLWVRGNSNELVGLAKEHDEFFSNIIEVPVEDYLIFKAAFMGISMADAVMQEKMAVAPHAKN